MIVITLLYNEGMSFIRKTNGSATFDPSSLRASRIYKGLLLKIYDGFVVYYSNHWMWDYPRLRQLDFYNRYATAHHAEVGLATTWYLENFRKRYNSYDFTLIDLSADALSYAQDRLEHGPIRSVIKSLSTIHTDILENIPTDKKFNSVGLNFVIHCLPGTIESKTRAIANIADILTDDGVLFGTTLLGQPAQSHINAKVVNKLYNRLGVFSNTTDTHEGLKNILEQHFHEVSIDEHWSGAGFVARRPKRVP